MESSLIMPKSIPFALESRVTVHPVDGDSQSQRVTPGAVGRVISYPSDGELVVVDLDDGKRICVPPKALQPARR